MFFLRNRARRGCIRPPRPGIDPVFDQTNLSRRQRGTPQRHLLLRTHARHPQINRARPRIPRRQMRQCRRLLVQPQPATLHLLPMARIATGLEYRPDVFIEVRLTLSPKSEQRGKGNSRCGGAGFQTWREHCDQYYFIAISPRPPRKPSSASPEPSRTHPNGPLQDARDGHLLHFVRQPRLHESSRITQISRTRIGHQQEFMGRDRRLVLQNAVLRYPQAE